MTVSSFVIHIFAFSHQYGRRSTLVAETSATGLDGLHLGLAPWKAVEALGQFGTVEKFTLSGLNGAQGSTGVAANSALSERSPAEGTVLLGLGAIRSERVRKNSSRRSGMRTRRVVDRFYCPGISMFELWLMGGKWPKETYEVPNACQRSG